MKNTKKNEHVLHRKELWKDARPIDSILCKEHQAKVHALSNSALCLMSEASMKFANKWAPLEAAQHLRPYHTVESREPFFSSRLPVGVETTECLKGTSLRSQTQPAKRARQEAGYQVPIENGQLLLTEPARGFVTTAGDAMRRMYRDPEDAQLIWRIEQSSTTEPILSARAFEIGAHDGVDIMVPGTTDSNKTLWVTAAPLALVPSAILQAHIDPKRCRSESLCISVQVVERLTRRGMRYAGNLKAQGKTSSYLRKTL